MTNNKPPNNHIPTEIETEDQDYYLWLLISKTRHYIFLSSTKELMAFRLTPVERATISLVQSLKKNATPSVISKITFRKLHSASEQLERLQKKGLVAKVRDLPSKRYVRYILTPKSRKILRQTEGRQNLHTIMSVLTNSERRQLEKTLTKLIRKAEEMDLKHIRIE
ncbi:MAG: winged helix-turn-helix transcriptional regulator [Dehalococcoidales bacterium]|nr:winged helix-turn-helix transcriptional regulator [Dehalococcoidales bacterium]